MTAVQDETACSLVSFSVIDFAEKTNLSSLISMERTAPDTCHIGVALLGGALRMAGTLSVSHFLANPSIRQS